MRAVYLFLVLAAFGLVFAEIHQIGIEEIINPPGVIRENRGACNSACSCGWGNCVPAPGYQDSSCCSAGYSWHCC